ncbi:MAG: hypothetical protein HGA54_00935 [Actinobacteria bacterium]|nr:hypothetical protein [Actinomycetota bacterium]
MTDQATLWEQNAYPEKKKILTGAEMEKRARKWIHDNFNVWCSMKRVAKHRALYGKRVSIAKLVEDVRDECEVDAIDGEKFKVNNSLRAPLARILITECPEVAPYIDTRMSKTDPILMGGKACINGQHQS